ncbi:hypothetical protein CTAYLR_000365 [Chrysophaeum taylorii]|uniref:Sulfatase N-terminal domain-containing protein n=1 Tax=Chrysophaeum taylorii TaxID=2483200 RepID=A0AAD7UGS0_9STRA|nr:hypothetical protein CTAYLR_000365 [Chrysophaeum taylorii]
MMKAWRQGYEAVAGSEVEKRRSWKATRMVATTTLAAVAVVILWYASGPKIMSGRREATTVSSSVSSKPNIVHIIFDDVGFNDLWESSDLEPARAVPNMTFLATRGVVLSNYYGQSYCTPARAALLTGKFPHKLGFAGADVRGGVTEVLALDNYSIPLGHALVPEVLKTKGYSTHGIGKWNVGHCNEAYLPWNRGFDTFLGYFSDGIDYVSHRADSIAAPRSGKGYIPIGNGTEFELLDLQFYEDPDEFEWTTAVEEHGGTYTSTLFAGEAARRIRGARGPAYVWLGYHGMHDNEGVANFNGTDDAYWDACNASATRCAFGKGLREIDDGVGAILGELRGKNTDFVMVLHSDNGGYPCGAHCSGNNYPLRGLKFFDFEGAVRVPALIYSNLFLPASGTYYAGLMHHVDWLATFASIAGGVLGDDDFDSVDHWEEIRRVARGEVLESNYKLRSEIVFSVDSKHASVRKYQYKLLLRRSYSGWYPPLEKNKSYDSCSAPSNDDYIFDLDNDPEEQENLWDHPKYANVKADLVQWAQDLYAREYFHLPLPRSDQLTSEIADAIYASTNNHSDWKVLVPWGCHLLYREKNIDI